MSQYLHTSVLQALGIAIVQSLWQYAFLWLLYQVIILICKFSAHTKYVLALCLQITGAVWFIGTLVFVFDEQLYHTTGIPLHNTWVVFLVNSVSETPVHYILKHTSTFFSCIALAYLAFMFYGVARWCILYRLTQQLHLSGLMKIDVRWRLFVLDVSAQLGIKKKVAIHISSKVTAPLTIGFIKPLILIPAATLTHLSPMQIEAIILHELAHIKRHDYLLNLVLALIDIILFFNPFCRLLGKQLKLEREKCCDDWVLQFKYNAYQYANALLKIAINSQKSYQLAVNAANEKNELLCRIKRMIEKRELPTVSFRYHVFAIVLAFITLGLLLVAGEHKKPLATNATIAATENMEPFALIWRLEGSGSTLVDMEFETIERNIINTGESPNIQIKENNTVRSTGKQNQNNLKRKVLVREQSIVNNSPFLNTADKSLQNEPHIAKDELISQVTKAIEKVKAFQHRMVNPTIAATTPVSVQANNTDNLVPTNESILREIDITEVEDNLADKLKELNELLAFITSDECKDADKIKVYIQENDDTIAPSNQKKHTIKLSVEHKSIHTSATANKIIKTIRL